MFAVGKQEYLNTEWANTVRKFREYSDKRGMVFVPQ